MGLFDRRRGRARVVRDGDMYELGEDVDRVKVAPDTYPEGQVDEPWETVKIVRAQWVRTDDPSTWKDPSRGA